MASRNRIEVHVVLTTKYRRTALRGLEKDIDASFARAAKGQDWTIVAMGVEDGNHVHVVLRLHPSVAVSDAVARLKQYSTFDLWEKRAASLRPFYWKKKRLLWGSGYFVDSVGRVPREKILAYVRKQQAE